MTDKGGLERLPFFRIEVNIMRFQSVPGRVVQKRVKRNGRKRIVALFKFDEKGFASIDETKYTATDLKSLKRLFKVVEEEKKEDVTKVCKCKKCDFETDNRGVLMTHYRSEHPKE